MSELGKYTASFNLAGDQDEAARDQAQRAVESFYLAGDNVFCDWKICMMISVGSERRQTLHMRYISALALDVLLYHA